MLKQYGIRLTANQAYHQMVKWGSSSSANDTAVPRLTTSKNLVADSERLHVRQEHHQSRKSRETQPHFFESRFPELLKLLIPFIEVNVRALLTPEIAPRMGSYCSDQVQS